MIWRLLRPKKAKSVGISGQRGGDNQKPTAKRLRLLAQNGGGLYIPAVSADSDMQKLAERINQNREAAVERNRKSAFGLGRLRLLPDAASRSLLPVFFP